MPWFYILVSINKHCDTWCSCTWLQIVPPKLWKNCSFCFEVWTYLSLRTWEIFNFIVLTPVLVVIHPASSISKYTLEYSVFILFQTGCFCQSCNANCLTVKRLCQLWLCFLSTLGISVCITPLLKDLLVLNLHLLFTTTRARNWKTKLPCGLELSKC